MWLALGLLITWTAVTGMGAWVLARLFPQTERPSTPQPDDGALAHWQARYERGEISAATFALIQSQIEQQQTTIEK